MSVLLLMFFMIAFVQNRDFSLWPTFLYRMQLLPTSFLAAQYSQTLQALPLSLSLFLGAWI